MNKLRVSAYFFLFLLLVSFVSAVDFFPSGNVIGRGVRSISNFTNISADAYYYNNGTLLNLSVGGADGSDNASWNESKAGSLFINKSSEAFLNVNRSDYWDGKDTANFTQFETNDGVLTVVVSWLNQVINSQVSGLNSTVNGLVTDNASWNQSLANNLYLAIGENSSLWSAMNLRYLTSNGNDLALNISALRGALVVTNTTLNTLSTQVTNLNTTLELERTKINNLNSSLTTKDTQLQNNINSNSNNISALRGAVVVTNTTLNTASTKLDNLNVTVELERTKINNLNSSLTTKDTQLQNNINSAQTNITNVNTTLELERTKINNLNSSKIGFVTSSFCSAAQKIENITVNRTGVYWNCTADLVGTGGSSFFGPWNYSQVINHPLDCSGSNYFQVGSDNDSRICSPINETAIARFDSYVVSGTANAWLIAGENITSGTVADARIASTIARDSEILMQVNQNVNTTGSPTFPGLTSTILNVTGTLNMSSKNITGVDYIIGKNGGVIIFS